MMTYDESNDESNRASPQRLLVAQVDNVELQQDEYLTRQQSTAPEDDLRRMAAWNATRQPYPTDACVPELVAKQAALTPDALAVSAGKTNMTYHELNRQANQLAHHLHALGVGPDIPVAICVERSAEMIVGLLAILKAGGAYVPMDLTYPPDRQAFILTDTQAPIVITHSSLSDRFSGRGVRLLCLDDDTLQPTERNDDDPAPTATPNNLAYIIYTSGSTGQPKGIQITHRSLLNLVYWHRRAFAITPADRATQLASPGFDAAVWEIWPHLTAGASLHLPDDVTRATPLALRDWLVTNSITTTFLPTTLAEGMLTQEWPSNTALRNLLTGADTLHRYPTSSVPFTLINNYGPTECTVVATSGPVDAQDHSESPPSIGRPIANTQVYILDEQLRQVPIGAPGELYIGGDGLARGYVNRPELTAEQFIPHPFSDDPESRLYRTGDLVRFLPDGEIAFLGRMDSQIKIRGYRIEPAEIVGVLNRQPGVQTSVVIAQKDPLGDAQLVAYIVPTPDENVTSGALRAAIAARLPEFMMPAAFVALEALPLTVNGKLNLASLPLPTPSNALRNAPGPADAPMSPIEERIAGIVAALLRLNQMGLDDNFFYVGGHSLLGAQLIARLSDAFGVEIMLRTLFEGPTVRELSAEIERLLVAKLEVMSDEEVARQLAYEVPGQLLPDM